MNWNVGFRAGYHACLVDRVTWQDGERFGITEGSINRTDTGLKESADLTATEYPHGMDRWIRIYLDAEQDGEGCHDEHDLDYAAYREGIVDGAERFPDLAGGLRGRGGIDARCAGLSGVMRLDWRHGIVDCSVG